MEKRRWLAQHGIYMYMHMRMYIYIYIYIYICIYICMYRWLTQHGRLCKGCELFCIGIPPTVDRYQKRDPDHRFEWTRVEFRSWATTMADKFGYNVRFDGVGGGPFDELRRQDDVFHGPGPMTQVAIFERQADLNGEEEWGDFNS